MMQIDIAHAELLNGLVVAGKPTSVLEMGFGAGHATEAILNGLEYNKTPYTYTLVDNWMDFNGQIPSDVTEKYADRLTNVITANERDFVFQCKDKFDLIMSDADHHNTEQWFEYVYENLLNDDGILCYHDVTLTSMFPNLLRIVNVCEELNLKHKVFNKDSLPSEMCFRGFLVIFK
jgi:predicted O-methyltransferase YrrM